MDDKTIQKKLNHMVKIANELEREAKKRWGTNAESGLFYESEGSFYVMSGDSDASASERQEFVKFSSHGFCNMGCGAW